MSSRQARYQARRRKESGGQVAFFPHDKAALDQVVESSGQSQQAWLADAVGQAVARQRPSDDAPPPPIRVDPETVRAVQAFVDRISDRYRVSGVILFGSRARGANRPDSDADLAVVLQDEFGKRSAVAVEMAGVAFDVFLDTGVLVDALPLRQHELDHPEDFSNPQLIENIRRDGVPE